MVEEACHDDVVVAADHPGNIFDGFPHPDFNVLRRKINGVAAHAIETGFEGDAGARRWLVENHGQRMIFKRFVVLPPFESGFGVARYVKHLPDFVGGQVINIQKITFHVHAFLAERVVRSCRRHGL